MISMNVHESLILPSFPEGKILVKQHYNQMTEKMQQAGWQHRLGHRRVNISDLSLWGRLSPTASCNLRLWQPSLKLLNVLQCPNTDRDAGFLLHHFFLWTYHSSFNTANTILKDGQRTCPPNCTSCLLFIAPPKDNDSWQIIVIIPDH